MLSELAALLLGTGAGGVIGYCLRAAQTAHLAAEPPLPRPIVRILPSVNYVIPGELTYNRDPARTAARVRLKVAADDHGLTEADLNRRLQARWPGAVWLALTTAQATAALADLEAAAGRNDLD